MTILSSEVEHIALLARLNIDESELEMYTRQLGDILESVRKLEQLNIENIEPTSHVLPLRNVFRCDEVKSGIDREEALRGAPEAYEGQFKVPRIV